MTVNLWVDGPVLPAAVRRARRRARCTGRSTRARLSRRRRGICRWSPAGPRNWRAPTTRPSRQRAVAQLSAARARPCGTPGAARRWSCARRRATFSLAPGAPPRPGASTPRRRVLSGGRLDRDGPAGDDRGRGRQRRSAADGRRRSAAPAASATGHNQRDGLGRRPLRRARAQGPQPALVHPHARPRHSHGVSADLRVSRVRALIGRIIVTLDDPADWPEMRARLARLPGIGNFALAHHVVPDLDAMTDGRASAGVAGRHGGLVPRAGAAGRQAVSPSLARHRAARRRATCRR